MTCEEARSTAKRWFFEISKGEDPSAKKQAVRSSPTLNDLAEKYMTEHAPRKKIELSLNVVRYNAANDTKQRYAMRLIFNIPEDDFFRLNYVNAYPLWLIQKELAQKNIIYKAVSRFVDALLHLGSTQGNCVSSFEALKLILGSSTLKMKAKTSPLDYVAVASLIVTASVIGAGYKIYPKAQDTWCVALGRHCW